MAHEPQTHSKTCAGLAPRKTARITSGGNAYRDRTQPLLVWVVIAGMAATLSDYESARAMVGHPVSAVAAICTIVALFHHAQLGLQVVIEDYIHQEWLKITALLAVKFLAVVFAPLGVIVVLRIAVGS